MDGQFLIKSNVQSPVASMAKPTPIAPPVDKTLRTSELVKGMNPPLFTRQTAPSINLGTM